MNHNFWQPSIHTEGDFTLYIFHSDSYVHRISSRGWWIRSWTTVKESLESQMISSYIVRMMPNMTGDYTSSWRISSRGWWINCEGDIEITDNVIIHGKDDVKHDRRLHKFMKVTRECGLVLNKKKSRATLSSSLDVFLTSTEPIQIHQRSVPSMRCLPHRTKESFRASLEW